jgi:hypothetical protein
LVICGVAFVASCGSVALLRLAICFLTALHMTQNPVSISISNCMCAFRFRFWLYAVRFISGRGEGEPSPEPF